MLKNIQLKYLLHIYRIKFNKETNYYFKLIVSNTKKIYVFNFKYYYYSRLIKSFIICSLFSIITYISILIFNTRYLDLNNKLKVIISNK